MLYRTRQAEKYHNNEIIAYRNLRISAILMPYYALFALKVAHFSLLCAMRPSDIVQRTLPCIVQPSKGVLRDLDLPSRAR